MSSLHSMSSLHHVANRRAGNISTVVNATPASQFQNGALAIRRLHSQMSAQLGAAWQLICVWRQRCRDRAALRSFSTREIRDFCPRETEAEQERNKPFWRA